MLDPLALDAKIDSLGEWIRTAGDALAGFYDAARGVFWRDTLARDASDSRISPTSTNRSFLALYEYLRFLNEETPPNEFVPDTIVPILHGVAEKYLQLLVTDADRARRSPDNRINMFTDSHLLISVSVLENLIRYAPSGIDVVGIRAAAITLVTATEAQLKRWGGGKVHKADEVHDFITLYALRALDAFGHSLPLAVATAVQNRAKEDLLRLLGFHFAGVSSRFDPTELAFTVAVLNRFPTPDAPKLTERAVRSIVECQAPDGAWPAARFVSYAGHGLLHVASYEVALTLTQLFHLRLQADDLATCQLILPALEQAFDLVVSYYNRVGEASGWANDHTRRKGLVESWATAIVLTYLMHFRDALMILRQRVVLQRLGGVVVAAARAKLPWPDMIPALRRPAWIESSTVDKISDPTDGRALAAALRREFVEPVAQNWIHRPHAGSLLLFGPPGSRKTTLVFRLSQALGWPIVTLSPPQFLRNGGLEGFEAAAAEIFVDLQRLRRAVVFFDECEDFFKRRPPNQHVESRTVGAFITAGMLPRLQNLRDRGWVIFVLATNSGLEDLDPAVIRLGRFDFSRHVDSPTPEAQARYVTETAANLAPATQALLSAALALTSSSPMGTPVSFAVLDRWIRGMGAAGAPTQPRECRELLDRFVAEQGPPVLQ